MHMPFVSTSCCGEHDANQVAAVREQQTYSTSAEIILLSQIRQVNLVPSICSSVYLR